MLYLGSGVAGLRGGGKVDVVGGRSGIVLFRETGLRGKTGYHAGLRLRSARATCSISDGGHNGTSNRASRGDNHYKKRIRIRALGLWVLFTFCPVWPRQKFAQPAATTAGGSEFVSVLSSKQAIADR
jgi:hypothetical protein